MDKTALVSYIKQLFRENLKFINYKIKGTTKDYLFNLAIQAYDMASNGNSLTQIYLKLTNATLHQKYNVKLSDNQLCCFKQIINKIKSIPIPSIAKGKVYDESHIILISL